MGLREYGFVIPLLILPVLAACSTSSDEPPQPAADRSITTGAIPARAQTGRPELSAATPDTLLGVLSGAVSGGPAALPLAWADGEARGVVTWIGKQDDACRKFLSTRESFDGVSLYKGVFCVSSAGDWQLRSFEAIDG